MADPLVTGRGTLAVPAFLPDATRAGVRGTSSEDLRADRHRGRRRERLPSAPASGRAGGAGGRRDPSVHGLGSADRQRLGRLPDLEPDPPGSEPRRHPRQRGDLPRAGDRREVEPDPRADREPPAPAGQRRGRLPRRLHRCGRAGGRAGALRRADRALGAPLPRGARPPGRASAAAPPPRIFAVVQGGGDRGAAAAVRDRTGRASASTATASAAGRSRPTARCSPSRCAGSSSRSRPRPRSTRSGSAAPDHVVNAFALGYSIFDCALPTRDARHGRLYAFRDGWAVTPAGAGRRLLPRRTHPRPARTGSTHGPIEEGCDCPVCARHSAAYLHHLFKVGDPSAERLATLHNLRFYVRLFELLRS